MRSIEESLSTRRAAAVAGDLAAKIDGAPKVLVIEDHSLVAQSLSASLQIAGFDSRVLLSPSVAETEQSLQWAPAIGLLDLDLGPAGDGTKLIEPLKRSGCEVMVLTAVTDADVLCRCYDAGVAAVVDKTNSIDKLIGALRSLLAGGDPTAADREELFARRRRSVAESRERFAPFELLTPREAEVLADLTEGRSPAEIAAGSGVSIWTVRVQIKHTLQKLGVNSQLAAVALARRRGWSRPSPIAP